MVYVLGCSDCWWFLDCHRPLAIGRRSGAIGHDTIPRGKLPATDGR